MIGRSGVVVAPDELQILTVEVSDPGPGEVRVRITECGLCGSDVKMFTGAHPTVRPPMVLGHECVGVVESVGEGVSTLTAGTSVVCFPSVGCNACAACSRGHFGLCSKMRMIGGKIPGGLAEYLVVPSGNLAVIPSRVPESLRVVIEPMAVAVRAVERIGDVADSSCLVLGCGPIGLFVALVLRSRGAGRVVVADRDAERLELARLFGIDDLLHLNDAAPADGAVAAASSAFDVVFECVGSDVAIDCAMTSSRPGGTVVLVGIAPERLSLDGIALQRQERNIVGSMMYTRQQFDTAMELLADGVVPQEVISGIGLIEYISFESAGAALRTMASGGFSGLKMVLRPAMPGSGDPHTGTDPGHHKVHV
jgi:threonine dehydrogenase-like Zn-dependent dehydrogenase